MMWVIRKIRDSALGFKLVSMILLCTTLPVLIVYSLSLTQGVDNMVKSIEGYLSTSSMELQSRFTSLHETLRAFQGTPPARGILRAIENEGIDPQDSSTTDTWQNRYNTIANVFLENYPFVTQIDYIYGGENVVLHARRAGKKIITAAPSDLADGLVNISIDKELLNQVVSANNIDVSSKMKIFTKSLVFNGEELTTQLAMPVNDPSANIKSNKGVISFTIASSVFWKILSIEAPITGGNEYITDADGEIIFSRRAAGNWESASGRSDIDLSSDTRSPSFPTSKMGGNGDTFVLRSVPILTTDSNKVNYWTHVYEIPKILVYKSVVKETMWLFWLMIGSLGIALAAGLYFSRRTSRNLTGFISDTRDEAQTIRDLTSQLTESSLAISSASQSQAASVEETASSVEELESMVKSNAQTSKNVAEIAKKTKERAHSGSTMMAELVKSIRSVADTSVRLEEFNKVFSNITSKTKLIDEIVSQTRLLSFNASIEAARAGEQGKGFAVVAEEIGNLAQLSGSAAREISEILEKSVEDLQSVVKDIDMVVDQSSKTSNETSESFQKITEEVTQVADLVDEISEANSEQWKGLKQISQAMHSIDQSTQGNAAASIQLDQTIKTLDGQAVGLMGGVDNLSCIILGAKSCNLTLKGNLGQNTSNKRNVENSINAGEKLGLKIVSRNTNTNREALQKTESDLEELKPDGSIALEDVPDDDDLFRKVG